jgi:hypothetical protein
MCEKNEVKLSVTENRLYFIGDLIAGECKTGVIHYCGFAVIEKECAVARLFAHVIYLNSVHFWTSLFF